MKKVEFELPESVYELWLNYKKKIGYTHDSGALFYLLTELRYSENDILNMIENAVRSIIDCNIELTDQQHDNLTFLKFDLCACKSCEEECLAHTDNKGNVAVSYKRFTLMLQRELSLSFGFFEVIRSCLHEVLHNLYPHATEKSIIAKTEKFFRKGIITLSKKAHLVDHTS